MKIALRVALAVLFAAGSIAFVGNTFGQLKKSDSEVKVDAKAFPADPSGKQEIVLTLAVNKGWHIYANPVNNEDFESARTTVKIDSKAGLPNVNVSYPKGDVHEVKGIGKMNVYHGKIEIRGAVTRAAGDTGPIDVSVKFMACSDGEGGQCLMPATVKLQVK